MNKKDVVFALAILAVPSVNTHAINFENYEKVKASDPVSTRMYMHGVGEGYSWANSALNAKGQAELYCQGDSLTLNSQNYNRILEDEIERLKTTPKLKKRYFVSMELVLFIGLQRAFPCDK